jgi:pimeloyl-ACP methyl ester carboxylesterase
MTLITSKRSTLLRLLNTVAAGALIGAGVTACGGGNDDPAEPAPTPAPDPVAANPATAFLSYKDPYHALVDAAGYVHKTALVNGVTLSYVEGPDNGPPLVLLHAQLLDWFSYSRVMPDLAKSFHVYTVDYQGHGKTITPANYPMTANQIGADLGKFIETVIGKPVYVTGNSSGGLLTTWLAANRPDLVISVLLEDPPLYSSEYPAIQGTVANKAFITSYSAATTDHPDDFLLYWVDKNSAFFTNNIGAGSAAVLATAIVAYRKANSGDPVEISLVKDDSIRMMLRGLDYQYDPRFGSAFYDGTWNAGFDHATALAKITCPVFLMQANTSYMADGTLDGAMSLEQTQQAMALFKNGTYLKVDSDHVINLADPAEYLKALRDFFLNQ